jgi:hypothetical protein
MAGGARRFLPNDKLRQSDRWGFPAARGTVATGTPSAGSANLNLTA